MDRSLLLEGTVLEWEVLAIFFLSWRSTGPAGMAYCRQSLLSKANDMLKSAFVLGCGSIIPDGGGGSDNALGVEMHHN